MKRVLQIAAATALGSLLAACGQGLSGTFEDEMGISRYEFERGGRVYMSVMGVEAAGEYEIEGERIVLQGPNGTMVLHRDGENLKGPMGLKLIRKD
jgi:hypothetical protein